MCTNAESTITHYNIVLYTHNASGKHDVSVLYYYYI